MVGEKVILIVLIKIKFTLDQSMQGRFKRDVLDVILYTYSKTDLAFY